MERMPDDTISIKMLIDADVREVWKAWTDPLIVLQWFGSDPEGKGLEARMDLRPGGAYEISFMNRDLAEHTCSGVYSEVEEFSRLVFSWVWKSEPGVESFVTVQFTPQGDYTLMQFE